MSLDFFERQKEQDCSIHSLNNALGRRAITKKEVVASINRSAAAFAFAVNRDITDPIVHYFRETQTINDTFFTAESVWQAAREYGQLKRLPKPILFFTGQHAIVTPQMKAANALIILGVDHDSAYHAIAVRNGFVYDSLNDGKPQELTDGVLKHIYSKVFGAYIVLN